MASKTSNPAARADAGRARKVDCLAAVVSEDNPPKKYSQASLPSRATLARQKPALKVNRLTWRWRCDASGANGDGLDSLLAFLNTGGRK